jgi:hypothetical protein
MVLVTILVVVVGIFGMKVVPEVIEYFKIVQAIKAVSGEVSGKSASVADVRKAYERRVIIDQIQSVPPNDLDVTKEGNNVVLSFAYTKRIPVFGPVSLLIDFEGSTAK